MSALHVIPLVFALAIPAGAAAQENRAPSPEPGAAAAMPQDCPMTMPRHDHGAERGTPAPMRGSCPMAAADAPVAKAKAAKRGHDHARFHKLM